MDFVSYENLKKEEVIKWLENILNVDDLKNVLINKIMYQINPNIKQFNLPF